MFVMKNELEYIKKKTYLCPRKYHRENASFAAFVAYCFYLAVLQRDGLFCIAADRLVASRGR